VVRATGVVYVSCRSSLGHICTAPDLRLFVSLHVNVDKTAAHSHGGSSPSRTHAYIHEPGSSIHDPVGRCRAGPGTTTVETAPAFIQSRARAPTWVPSSPRCSPNNLDKNRTADSRTPRITRWTARGACSRDGSYSETSCTGGSAPLPGISCTVHAPAPPIRRGVMLPMPGSPLLRKPH
jgi:hypothetical protein